MKPENQAKLQSAIDDEYQTGEVKPINALVRFEDMTSLLLSPTPVVVPPPVPQPTPQPTPGHMNTKHNAPDQFAHHVPAGGSLTINDEIVDNGGILVANLGAKSIQLNRVTAVGEIHGSGVYRVILASSPVESFVWDNTGLDHEIVNGGEAAIRVMGGAKNVTLINVNFRCRKHDRGDNTGKKSGTPGVPQDYWKQVQQWRDVRKGLVKGGRTIGPIDLGEQKNTAKTPQRVDELTFDGHAMTSLPTITDRHTIGKVTILNCPKIDSHGQPLKDNQGHVQMWPNGNL